MKSRLILVMAVMVLWALNVPVLLAQGNRALSLDGVNDYVRVSMGPNLLGSSTVTLEAWVKSSSTSGIGCSRVIEIGTDSGNSTALVLDTNCSGRNIGEVRAWVHTTGSRKGELKNAERYNYNDDRWHHLAFTYDGKNTKLYIDGVLQSTGSVSGTIDSPAKTLIGQHNFGRPDNENTFGGFIDEVRIWNVARTQEEIQATMNRTLNGNEPGLVGYWNFNDGTANDRSPNDNHGELKGDAKIVESDLEIAPIVVAPRPITPRTVGESFTLAIDTATSADLHNFTFDLTFDMTILRAVSVDSSSFLSNNGANPITCETPQIDNATGRIMGISCQRDDGNGVSGSGVLATITFEAIEVGESTLQIENASFSAPDGNSIGFGTREGSITVFGPHGRITGHVVDFEGRPVRGVEVAAFKENNPIGIDSTTDSNGDYTIENITEGGEIYIQARVPGLVSGHATVPVAIGETASNVTLVLLQPDLLHGIVDAEGFIRNWLLLGPIPWEDDSNRLNTNQLDPNTKPGDLFPPQETGENSLQPQEGTFGTGLAETQRWTLHLDSDKDIDLAGLYGQVKDVVYAFTRVKSPKTQEVKLLLGSGDGVIVWLNDQLVHRSGAVRNRSADQDTVENLTLNEGYNRLLIKVENQGGGWGFLARFADASGTPITDLDVQPQPLPSSDGGITIGTFNLSLVKGLNHIALPVKPQNLFTAQRLIDKLGGTMLAKFDTARQTFVPYLPGLSNDFSLEGGIGYIINVTESQTASFTGTVWDNTSAAPAKTEFSDSKEIWAFAVGGMVRRSGMVQPTRQSTITVRNLRTGEILRFAQNDRAGWAQNDSTRYAVAFADLSRRSVVEAGDVLEIGVEGIDEAIRYHCD